jgi:hypothetical protein
MQINGCARVGRVAGARTRDVPEVASLKNLCG